MTQTKEEYIANISDGRSREYRGFYNKDEDTYILKYTDNKDDDISKKSTDIKEALFDPFYELKMIHQTNNTIKS